MGWRLPYRKYWHTDVQAGWKIYLAMTTLSRTRCKLTCVSRLHCAASPAGTGSGSSSWRLHNGHLRDLLSTSHIVRHPWWKPFLQHGVITAVSTPRPLRVMSARHIEQWSSGSGSSTESSRRPSDKTIAGTLACNLERRLSEHHKTHDDRGL
jgi:hypothetical protein